MLRVLVCLLLLGVLVQYNTSVVDKHQDNKDWFNAQVDDEAVESSVPNVSALCPHSSFSHRHFCELCINPAMAEAKCAGRLVGLRPTVFPLKNNFLKSKFGLVLKAGILEGCG